FVLAVVGYGLTNLAAYNLRAAEQAEAKPGGAGPAQAGAPDLAAARKARLGAARNAFDKVWQLYRRGWYDEEQVYRWSVRLSGAERAVAGTKAQRVAAFAGHLARMKELEQWAPGRLPLGPPYTRPPLPLASGEAPLRTDKGGTILVRARDIAPSDIA